jgi:hypothetical protein
VLEVCSVCSLAEPPGEQQEEGPLAHASQRENERACGGRIEPLDVVDRDHDRRLRGENGQRAPDGDSERPRIRTEGSVFDEECSLERTASRR